tara:strand:- start:109 stop:525 length:417 start_codon:yes stop_codon:yes gene_type:complete
MNLSEDSFGEVLASHTPQEEHPQQIAERLRKVVSELASVLRPFPSFFGMNTLRAIELELPAVSGFHSPPQLGCVVVLEDGEISELDLKLISGPDNSADFDQIEEFTELDLPPEQFIAYAKVAVRILQAEIERRGGSAT